MASSEIPTNDLLIYDGDCPICVNYVGWTQLRSAHPDIQLLNAREHPALVEQLRGVGIEINDTFLLQIDGKRFVGAQAMAIISALMPGNSTGNALLKLATRSKVLVAPIYPVLVWLRKRLLALMGRDQIR